MNDSPTIKYPSRLILIDAYIVYFCWFNILSLVAALVSGLESRTTIISWFGFFFIFAIAHFIVSFRIKCLNCSSYMVISFNKAEPFSEENKTFGIVGWAGTLMSAQENGKFTCMHCGQKNILH